MLICPPHWSHIGDRFNPSFVVKHKIAPVCAVAKLALRNNII